jgi:hypothetical protein
MGVRHTGPTIRAPTYGPRPVCRKFLGPYVVFNVIRAQVFFSYLCLFFYKEHKYKVRLNITLVSRLALCVFTQLS